MTSHFRPLVDQLSSAVGHGAGSDEVVVVGDGSLPSAFAVSDLAAAAVANAALAVRRVVGIGGGADDASVTVDRRLASLWFGASIEPVGWELPPVWDSIAGIYETAGGFVRLHTNAPHHRAAALRALEVEPDRAAVAATLASSAAEAVGSAVVAEGGVAAALRSRDQWVAHGQGTALQLEPLVHRSVAGGAPSSRPAAGDRRQPLAGVRVLDLTRVLAGPVATRLLALLGADVLRIDPPSWSEPGVAVEVNLGKRCARLDLRASPDRAVFEQRLAEADIVVHGYRRDALTGLGYDEPARRAINPDLVDVSLNAWGHTGPWRDRRGFDSIVQIASGVAHRGMVAYGADRPCPLPVQALDHATGYTLAACALHGWADRLKGRAGSTWKTSLAAHAELLWPTVDGSDLTASFDPLAPDDLADGAEDTSWGGVRRARFPLAVAGVQLRAPNGAADHGTSPAMWRTT